MENLERHVVFVQCFKFLYNFQQLCMLSLQILEEYYVYLPIFMSQWRNFVLSRMRKDVNE